MVNDVLTMFLSTINYPLSSITIIIIDHDSHHDFHVSTVSASFWKRCRSILCLCASACRHAVDRRGTISLNWDGRRETTQRGANINYHMGGCLPQK
jgi:hypothetical protein